MSKPAKGERRYNPHGTYRVEQLAGIKLASFKHRFWAFAVDSVILSILMIPFAAVFQLGINELKHPTKGKIDVPGVHIQYDTTKDAKTLTVNQDKQETSDYKYYDPVFALLYYGKFVWRTNGQTPGKKWMGIRVVSLSHDRITLWQSCERALGYGASMLEGFFGFFQFFIYPNRTCVHDRIAETIVIEDPPRDEKAAQQEAAVVNQVARKDAEEAQAIDEELLKP